MEEELDTVSEVSSASIETKAQLVHYVREWVRIDNEMALLQTKLNDRKKEKKAISKGLMEAMKQNNVHEFDLKDGVLVYSQRQVKKPITKKYLMDALSTYFQGNNDKAGELNQYIMENREINVQEKLVHKKHSA